MINIDKVAYKEVNFKSKLIEWSQKNRVKLEFVMLGQEKEENGSPVFTYQAVIEGVKGGEGKGYSKKESQQLASKLTLENCARNRSILILYLLPRQTVRRWKKNLCWLCLPPR